MIDTTTEVSTQELCELVDLTKQRIGQLEAAGIIHRAGRDRWLLQPTLKALFADARTRSAQHSEARLRLENARAVALEMKTQREAGDLCPTAAVENYTRMAFGRIVAECAALPPRYTRDLREQNRLEGLLNDMRTRVSDFLNKEGDDLWTEARKAARRRS